MIFGIIKGWYLIHEFFEIDLLFILIKLNQSVESCIINSRITNYLIEIIFKYGNSISWAIILSAH